MIKIMEQSNFKNISRRLVIELVLVVAVVSYKVNFPKGTSLAQSWGFVLTHPLVLLHVIVGTIILVEAILLLIRSVLSHHRSWIVLASAGLVLVILAFASGESFLAAQRNIAISIMGDSWFGAIVIYGLCWFLNRKKASTTINSEDPVD